ncbi:MAG: CBS domain-containing protein [Gammaproteobacteria bacterium]|nr:CBS domain-containing protein [Gammaproteobacteria bacterium]MDH3411366.1 CBS domain-containing protein [Gammaproteobacteria bacterium]
MKAGEICNHDVVTVSPEDSIRRAAELMRQHHVGDVVVADRSGGFLTPLGILTDRDIVVAVIAENIGLDDVSVRDTMSDQLVTANEDDDLLATLMQMRENGVRRLPVVDGKGELVGILSADDVIGLVARELAEVWALIVRQKGRETKLRSKLSER